MMEGASFYVPRVTTHNQFLTTACNVYFLGNVLCVNCGISLIFMQHLAHLHYHSSLMDIVAANKLLFEVKHCCRLS
jgi:hypothetical protein